MGIGVIEQPSRYFNSRTHTPQTLYTMTPAHRGVRSAHAASTRGGPAPRKSKRAKTTVVREPSSDYRAAPLLWIAAREPARDAALLLDTHVWLWMLSGTPDQLSSEAIALIERAAESHALHVSDVSYWELAMLVAKGRLMVHGPLRDALSGAVDENLGIRTLPVSRAVLLQSAQLPGEPHGDPMDRILLAQARLHGLSLVTCDRELISYAERTSGVPVCDARTRVRR